MSSAAPDPMLVFMPSPLKKDFVYARNLYNSSQKRASPSKKGLGFAFIRHLQKMAASARRRHPDDTIRPAAFESPRSCRDTSPCASAKMVPNEQAPVGLT